MSLSLPQPDSETFLNEVLIALKSYESREALVRHACGEGTLDGFRNAFDAFIHATQLFLASPTLQSRENIQDEPEHLCALKDGIARVTDQDALNALSVLLLTSPKPAATEENCLAWRSMYELVETSWDDHDAMLPFESVYGNLSLLGLEDMHQRRVEDLFRMAFRRDDGGLSFRPRGSPCKPRHHYLVQKHYDRFPSNVECSPQITTKC